MNLFTLLSTWLRPVGPASEIAPAVVAPDTGIVYKPLLIPELRSEHAELVRSYRALVSAHQNKDFDTSVANLKHFTVALRAHLLKENLHLYVYLKYALRHDQESAALMGSMRHEMGKIGRALNDFVTRYTSSPWDSEARENLRGELFKIEEILMLRIQQEEEVLYPMYIHPSRYR